MSGEAQATEYMAAPQKKKRGSFGPLIAIVTVGVMDQEPTHILSRISAKVIFWLGADISATLETRANGPITLEGGASQGLLKPDEQPSIAPNKPPAAPVAQLAARLAESVDPFLHQSGG